MYADPPDALRPVHMLWDPATGPPGTQHGHLAQRFRLLDPRVATFPAVLRINRWRLSDVYKRSTRFVDGSRRELYEPYKMGDLRMNRILRTMNPSVARETCRVDVSHLAHIQHPEK